MCHEMEGGDPANGWIVEQIELLKERPMFHVCWSVQISFKLLLCRVGMCWQVFFSCVFLFVIFERIKYRCAFQMSTCFRQEQDRRNEKCEEHEARMLNHGPNLIDFEHFLCGGATRRTWRRTWRRHRSEERSRRRRNAGSVDPWDGLVMDGLIIGQW